MIREYDQLVKEQSAIASKLYQLHGALTILKSEIQKSLRLRRDLEEALEEANKILYGQLTPVSRNLIQNWPEKIKATAGLL